MKRLLTLGFILSLTAHAQVNPDTLEGHPFKWTDNRGINYAGEISKGVGIAVVSLERKDDFLVVRLVFTNFGMNPLYVDVANFAIIDKSGRTYLPTLDVTYTRFSNFFFKTLNPYETNEGFLYIRVPQSIIDEGHAQICYRYPGMGIKIAHFPLEVKPW